jgi:bile acid:Na+ symporter, BASS family
MSIATLIPLAIQLSLALLVFSIALHTRVEDLTYLFRRPKLLLRSLFSMNVVMPVFAVALAKGLDLTPVVKGALVLLAISPLPPVFPNKALKAGGERSYTIGLLVAATLISIVFIPIALELIERAFDTPLQMSPAAVVKLVLWTLLLPLAVGVGVHRLAPAFAERAGKPIAKVGVILLIVALLPVLIKVWPAMMSLIGNGTILVMVVFALVGLVVGHLLGGPDVEQRTVLALSTATRHPGIAIAIAAVNFPDQKLAPAAILLYLLVSALVAKLYLVWLKRRSVATVPAPAGT